MTTDEIDALSDILPDSLATTQLAMTVEPAVQQAWLQGLAATCNLNLKPDPSTSDRPTPTTPTRSTRALKPSGASGTSHDADGAPDDETAATPASTRSKRARWTSADPAGSSGGDPPSSKRPKRTDPAPTHANPPPTEPKVAKVAVPKATPRAAASQPLPMASPTKPSKKRPASATATVTDTGGAKGSNHEPTSSSRKKPALTKDTPGALHAHVTLRHALATAGAADKQRESTVHKLNQAREAEAAEKEKREEALDRFMSKAASRHPQVIMTPPMQDHARRLVLARGDSLQLVSTLTNACTRLRAIRCPLLIILCNHV